MFLPLTMFGMGTLLIRTKYAAWPSHASQFVKVTFASDVTFVQKAIFASGALNSMKAHR